MLALLSKTWAALHSIVGVSRVLISNLKAAGPQFELGNSAAGQIEMISPKENRAQRNDIISQMIKASRDSSMQFMYSKRIKMKWK